MSSSIIFVIALALSNAAITHAQTARPSKPETAAPQPPAGVDPKLTSADPEYGYSQKKPIKVGTKGEFGGPSGKRAYLNSLRDEAGNRNTHPRN